MLPPLATLVRFFEDIRSHDMAWFMIGLLDSLLLQHMCCGVSHRPSTTNKMEESGDGNYVAQEFLSVLALLQNYSNKISICFE